MSPLASDLFRLAQPTLHAQQQQELLREALGDLPRRFFELSEEDVNRLALRFHNITLSRPDETYFRALDKLEQKMPKRPPQRNEGEF